MLTHELTASYETGYKTDREVLQEELNNFLQRPRKLEHWIDLLNCIKGENCISSADIQVDKKKNINIEDFMKLCQEKTLIDAKEQEIADMDYILFQMSGKEPEEIESCPVYFFEKEKFYDLLRKERTVKEWMQLLNALVGFEFIEKLPKPKKRVEKFGPYQASIKLNKWALRDISPEDLQSLGQILEILGNNNIEED
jgi:hypothetical protein